MEEKSRDFEDFPIVQTAEELGLGEFHALLADWERLATNKKVYGGKPILPNLYVVAENGISISPFAEELACYLHERKIMPFYGKVLSYSYYLSYPTDQARESQDPFPSFRAFYEIVHKELVYYDRPFQGLLCIDITDWVSRGLTRSDPFQAFLAFMSDLDDDTLALFVSHESNEKKNLEAYKSLAGKSRLKRVNLALTSSSWGMKILRNALYEEGLTLSDDAASYLEKSVAIILHSPGNSGSDSLEQLALDIAYGKYISRSGTTSLVSLEDVQSYGPESEWIANFRALKKAAYGLLGED